MNRTLGEISSYITCTLSESVDKQIHITGVTTDSRAIQPGQLFIPLTGEQFDGHAFVQDSIAKGAAAAFWKKGVPNAPADAPLIYVDDPLLALQQLAASYRRSLTVRVIAVTGSNGKTTTKDMLASILSTTYNVVKTEGNYNNHIGLPLTLLQLKDDTDFAVVEMGMSGRKEIALLSELAQPEAAIITNVGDAHMLQLGSRKEIANAKLEVLKAIQSDGMLIYPGEEPLIHERLVSKELFAKEVGFPLPERLKTWSFGGSERSNIYPTSVMKQEMSTHFHLNTVSGATYTVPVPGWHNVLNAVASIAMSRYMGVLENDAVRGLKTVKLSAMRTAWVKTKSGLTIINDAYNASPTSVKAAIHMFADLEGFDQKYIVLGDMLELGPDEQKYHEEIGELLTPNQTDYVFTFGQLAEHIAKGAKRSFPDGTVRSFQTLPELSAHLARVTTRHDAVLVKGSRGMKLETVIQYLQDSVNG